MIFNKLSFFLQAKKFPRVAFKQQSGLLGFCSLLLSVNLSAQTLISNIEDTVKTQEIREISIYSSKKTPKTSLLTLPAVSVTKNELEASPFFTPADALQRKAGISLTRDGLWATSVSIRGLSKERMLILADGERIQTATDIAAALSTIDLNSLERIEVIKGAGSVLYGTGAMGGVVNFVTEHPLYTPDREIHGRAGTGFNTVNKLWTNHAKVQLSENNWYLAVNGSYRMAQNTETPEGRIDNSQFNDASFGLQGGMTYDDNSQELIVNYQHYEAWNVGLPGGNAFPNNARVHYRSVKRNLISGEYVFYEPVSPLNEIRIKAYTQNISRDVESYVEARNLTILPSSENVTTGAKILTDWNIASSQALKVGAEGWLRDVKTKRYRIEETGDREYIITGEQPIPDGQMLDLGLFAQYSWKIHPQKLRLDAGIRLDYIQTKNDSAFNPMFQYTIANGVRTNSENLQENISFAAGQTHEFSHSAHLDFVYNPIRKHKITLSLSNAYRTASLEERFKYIDLSAIPEIGNPNLKPEKGIFSNVAYAFLGDKFTLKTDLFANYLFNLIASSRQQYTKPDGEIVSALVNTNIDNATFFGFEMEASYWFQSNLWATSNASFTYARDVKNAEFLPEIPPAKGFTEFNYRIQNLFAVSASVNWAANQYNVASGEQKTDAYAVFNAAFRTIKLDLNKAHLQFFAGVDNIFNTIYYNHLRTTRGIIQAEPGRNFYAKVQFGW